MNNYKILRISGVHYFSALNTFLRDNPNITSNSYDEILKLFFKSKLMFSDGFLLSFNQLGHEASEIIIDFEILQKQWALENGISYKVDNWLYNIMMAQIKQIKPDIVYIQSTMFTKPGIYLKDRPGVNLIKILKDEFPFIKKIISFSGYPSSANRIEGADIFFTSDPGMYRFYKNLGLNSFVLYHSFDEQILQEFDSKKLKYDFTFVGSTRAPESRYWALKQLLDQTDLKVWIHENSVPDLPIKIKLRNFIKSALHLFSDNQLNYFSKSKFFPRKIINIINEILNEDDQKEILRNKGQIKFLSKLYPDRCNESIIGLDYYKLLSQSSITFNKHADKSYGSVGNMRMFEATGVGTCLLTDTGENMKDLFEVDKEVISYSTIDEAIDKLNYIMDHPNEARQIAKAGQLRTLKDHTILNRCKEIDEVIQQDL